MKLIGYIDGIEVRFDFYPPSKWRAIVPKEITGKYILQLKALDTAGNESNFSDLFVCIDFRSMKFNVLDKQYNFQNKDSKFLCIQINKSNSIKDIENSYIYNTLDNKFSYKELVII